MTLAIEDDQFAQLRDWWQRSGKPLLAGGVLALSVVVGWQVWQNKNLVTAQNASVLYQQLLTAALTEGEVNVAEVARLGNQLKADYASTHYAQYARLFLARVAVDAGRLNDAAAELRVVIEKPVDPTLKELGRQRLARIWAVQNEPQRGVDLLSGDVEPAFAASREELRGDLLLQLGRIDEARTAYQKAKESLTSEASSAALQLKLDDLAREGTSSDA